MKIRLVKCCYFSETVKSDPITVALSPVDQEVGIAIHWIIHKSSKLVCKRLSTG